MWTKIGSQEKSETLGLGWAKVVTACLIASCGGELEGDVSEDSGEEGTEEDLLVADAPFLDVAVGENFTCAIGNSGAGAVTDVVSCWGTNGAGQLGAAQGPLFPSSVDLSLYQSGDLAVGSRHACLITNRGLGSTGVTGGDLWCWGANNRGQRGDGTTTGGPTPTKAALSDVHAVTAGREHTCAIKRDRTVWCWGANHLGQLGNGTTADSRSPLPVRREVDGAPLMASQLASGDQFNCVTGDPVLCWGNNGRGQLGVGFLGGGYSRARPIAAHSWSGYPFSAVAAGREHACAVRLQDEYSVVWCWGRNDLGQVGNGSTVDQPTPVYVLFQEESGRLVAGGDQSYFGALRWGAGYRLESGLMTDPTVLRPSFGGNIARSASTTHACRVTTTGPSLGQGLWCWGNNAAGQIGNDRTHLVPTFVATPHRVTLDSVTGADLIISESTGPVTVAPGGTLSLQNTVRNRGASGVASTFEVGFYLSTDSTITTADLRIGTRLVSGLAAGAAHTQSTVISIPVSLSTGPFNGIYFLGAIADPSNQVTEANENNNVHTGNGIQIGFDLVITALSAPTTVVPTKTYIMGVRVRNQGPGVSAEFDVVLNGRTVAQPLVFAAGSENWINFSYTAFDGPGGNWVAEVRRGSGDRNVANNVFTGSSYTVVKPDLVIDAVTSPTSVIVGAPLSISSTVRNQGAGEAVSFAIGFYLSADATITTADRRIGSRGLPVLAAGGMSAGTVSITVPSVPAGVYYLGAIADDTFQRPESNETNNALIGNQCPGCAPVRVTVTGPDLVMTAISAPNALARGTQVTISGAVRNQGQIAVGSFLIRFFLSTDQVVTTGDVGMTGSLFVTGLAANTTMNFNTTVTLPSILATRDYFVGAIADAFGDRIETNETNNALAGNAVTVQ